MKFKIEIDCTDAEFGDNPAPEIIRILSCITRKLDELPLLALDGTPILSMKGDKVGEVTID